MSGDSSVLPRQLCPQQREVQVATHPSSSASKPVKMNMASVFVEALQQGPRSTSSPVLLRTKGPIGRLYVATMAKNPPRTTRNAVPSRPRRTKPNTRPELRSCLRGMDTNQKLVVSPTQQVRNLNSVCRLGLVTASILGGTLSLKALMAEVYSLRAHGPHAPAIKKAEEPNPKTTTCSSGAGTQG